MHKRAVSNEINGDDRDRLREIEHRIELIKLLINSSSNDDRLMNVTLDGANLHLTAAHPSGSADPAKPSPRPLSFAEGRARLVRDIILFRRKRERLLGERLFADPVWDMMLDLYAAHYEGVSVSISSLCIAAYVPATTALRGIKAMIASGHFIREDDPNDGRRSIITMSSETRAKMDRLFDNL